MIIKNIFEYTMKILNKSWGLLTFSKFKNDLQIFLLFLYCIEWINGILKLHGTSIHLCIKMFISLFSINWLFIIFSRQNILIWIIFGQVNIETCLNAIFGIRYSVICYKILLKRVARYKVISIKAILASS